MSLNGKTALVTGGAAGIGNGCAVELARAGANVVLNDRPGSESIEQAAEEIRALGVNCHVVTGDVFEASAAQAVVAKAIDVAGQIDILVSNPAYSRRGSFLEYPVEEFDRTIQGTLRSGFVISQAVARHLVQRNSGGKIVFISSVQAEMPLSLSFAYGGAKAALNHMAQTIAVELSQHRINVNVIEPGWIDTAGERKTFGAERVESAGRELPWGRIGLPEDIGHAAAFLASPAADYITGVVLPVDGLFRFKDCCPNQVIAPQ